MTWKLSSQGVTKRHLPPGHFVRAASHFRIWAPRDAARVTIPPARVTAPMVPLAVASLVAALAAADTGGPKPHSNSSELVNPCIDVRHRGPDRLPACRCRLLLPHSISPAAACSVSTSALWWRLIRGFCNREQATKPYHNQSWCDPALPVEQRIDDMISRMSLPEKIASLASSNNAIPSLGLPSYSWRSEAEHGIEYARFDQLTPYATDFAFPTTLAMSFNKSLARAVGSQVGAEARALMNVGNADSTFWTPVINLGRDPRWGRNFETPGEDPYLTGEYAASFVQGFQESPVDPTNLQASACCKHYDANSMEKTTEAGVSWNRHDFNANVTMQDLVDSYMPGFQACVEKVRKTPLFEQYIYI
jgi:hypothetical protein